MSDEWSVVDIAVSEHWLPADEEAEVEVAVAEPEGASAEWSIYTEREADGRWVIPEPFATVSFGGSPLWYFDVNGLRVPARQGSYTLDYLVLPGFYDFYPRIPPGVQVTFADRLLGPGGSQLVAAREVALTDTGRVAIQKAVDAYVDACARSTEQVPYACPFAAATYSILSGFSIGWGFDEGVQWTVREYPNVAAVWEYSFLIADRQRGVVELRGTVDWVEPDQGPPADAPEVGSTAAIECEIDTSNLAARFTENGAVVIAVADNPYAKPDAYPLDDPGTAYLDTCRYATLA